MDELRVFAGNAHPALAKDVCDYLGIPVGESEVFQFSNENIFVRILENVRSRDVFVVQPICSPVNTSLVELLIMIDAFRRASAGRITAVVPYYGYGRTDKKDQPRVPITARLIADLISTAGANRLLTVDLHAPQIQGFFTIPVDELTALSILSQYFSGKSLENLVVVATDIGISKRARDVAAKLGASLAIIEKRRLGNSDATEGLNVIGEVEGMCALTVDDEIDTAG
ncbi:MAG: ribose-phosphate diphosphokinase, partial [Dehalococcoidia bacterium]|nr:ribose-phosphate diphosphokinase [Dehalococcoidia bacterium]